MDILEKLATLGTQDTGRRKTKQKTQKTKKMSTRTPTKIVGEPRCYTHVPRVIKWLWKVDMIEHLPCNVPSTTTSNKLLR